MFVMLQQCFDVVKANGRNADIRKAVLMAFELMHGNMHNIQFIILMCHHQQKMQA